MKSVAALYHSDPTYEAWKLEQVKEILEKMNDSDPTYEAWKLAREFRNSFSLNLTPILPMRHGNLGLLKVYVNDLPGTPILPMRHGNSQFYRRRYILECTPILPMRHGNFY